MITQKVDLYSDTDSEPDRGEVRANIVWKGKEHPIYEGENIIGREDDCDVTLEHESVSLKHAVLDFEDGVARMRDLKSKNGTSVESPAESGSFVKLGPTRRNEVVMDNARIRFGLVDCKFILLGQGNSAEPAPKFKIDCETQFINLPPLDDDDDEEVEILPPSGTKPRLAGSGSIQVLQSRPSIMEQDTQINASLTSAEKAPVAQPSSPLNFISGLVGSGRTPTATGNAGVGIGYGSSPYATTPADMNIQRTASSQSSTPFLKPPLPVSSPNGTDVGEETEDEGMLVDEGDDNGVGLDAVPRAPSADLQAREGELEDSDSEMSQDLMRVAEEEVEDVAGNDIVGGAEGADRHDADADNEEEEAAGGGVPVPSNRTADEENFPFAQDDDGDAEGVQHELPEEVPTAPGSPSQGSTGSVPATPGSPFHDLGGSAYFTADTHPVDAYPEPHLPTLPAIAEAPSQPLDSVAILQDDPSGEETVAQVAAAASSSGELNASTASSNGGVQVTTGPSRCTAEEVDVPARTPGAAIQELLRQSGMPEDARVFNTQGEILGAALTASPKLSSATSSYPPDAPPVHFDFRAAAAAAPQHHPDRAAADSEGDEEMEVEDAPPVAQSAAKPRRTGSVQTTGPASTAKGKGRKRILDDEDENDAVAPSSRLEDATTAAESAVALDAPDTAAKANSRNVRARKTRSNDPGDLGEALPVTTEVPFSQPTPEKLPTKRNKRFLDDSDDDVGGEAGTAAAVAAKEVSPAELEEAPATVQKKGRGKGKAAAATAAEAPTEGVAIESRAEEAAVAKPAAAAKKGKGKAAAIVQETTEVPDLPPVEIPEPAAATGTKKGRGGKRAEEVPSATADVTAMQVDPVSAPDAAPAPPAAVVAASKKARGGKQRAEEPEPVPAATIPEEILEPAAPVKKAGKKGAAASAVVSPVETADIPPEPLTKAPAPETSKGGKKGTKKAADPLEEAAVVAEPEVVAEPAVAPVKKGTKKSGTGGASSEKVEKNEEVAPTAAAESAAAAAPAAAEEDLGVRIMFTKVDDAPYAKVLKALPNVTLVADANLATHCVTLPELKRTPKLMVAINCGAKYVVTEQWAKDCIKAKSIVDVIKPTEVGGKKGKTAQVKNADPRADADLLQQLAASTYIVHDAEKEKLWNFNMAVTLAIPRSAPGSRKLFEGFCFFCTKGVCGETAPPADELCAIIESGGGVWLTSLEDWTDNYSSGSAAVEGKGAKASKKGGKSAAEQTGAEAAHALVVLTHPNVMKKELNKKLCDALDKCTLPGSGVYSMELVFLACLRQRLDFEESRLR